MADYVIAKYIRLSMDDAQSHSMSIENQRLIIDAHIAELDIPNAETIEFVDNGYSGTNFERPAVQELLELVRNGGVNCIIVKDFSRFGRNAIETGYFIEQIFPLYRVRFISVSDYFDSVKYDGNTGDIDVVFKFFTNEWYSRDISQKIKAARREKMKRGEAVSKNCVFGYMLNEKRQMVIDEPAAETVRLIFKLALEGKSIRKIAEYLYDEKRPTPGEYKKNKVNPLYIWELSVIKAVLFDEQYTGLYVAGKTKNVLFGTKTQIKQPESEWVKIPNHHPVIIDKKLFDAVREIKSEKSESRGKRKNGVYNRYGKVDSPLKGKVICGGCGHTMQLTYAKNARFICDFTSVAVDSECYRLSISARELADAVFGIITEQVQTFANIDDMADKSELLAKTERQSDYEKQIEKINNEKYRLYERFVIGEVVIDDYRAAKTNLDTELARITRINADLLAEKAKFAETKTTGNEYRKLAEKVSGENTLTRSLADMLIDKIYVYPGNRITVEWKIADFGSSARGGNEIC